MMTYRLFSFMDFIPVNQCLPSQNVMLLHVEVGVREVR